MTNSATPQTYFSGKDMFLLGDGATYHLGVKAGDLFPRILTVGSRGRAEAISRLFDADKPVRRISSNREMHTFSGYFNGVGVSIISIGMGAPMMDFMVREASYVLEGPMAVVRLGTCGLLNRALAPGTVVTAGSGAVYCYTNYAKFSGSSNDESCANGKPYVVTKPVPGCKELNNLLCEGLKDVTHHDGLMASAETFYSCQGRADANFADNNEGLTESLAESGADFLEMEGHQLFHLASLKKQPLYVACAAIGIVNRMNTEMTANISEEDLHRLESTVGKAGLEALTQMKL